MDRNDILPCLIARRAETQPDRLFLQDVEGRKLTWGALHEANLTYADALRRLGVGPGDTVATLLPNSFEAYFAWLGTAWLRAMEVPINRMYRGRMLKYIVANCGARVMLVGSQFLPVLADVASELEGVEKVVVPDTDDVDISLPFEVYSRADFLEKAVPADDLKGPERWDIAAVVYTSGTTGPSKGVLLPWGAAHLWGAVLPPDAMPEGGAYYSCWPPSHGTGKGALYLPALCNARLVTREVFSVSEFWNDIRDFSCTSCFLPGPLARMLLLEAPHSDDADNPLIRIVCVPLFPELNEFEERFGVKFCTAYGSTEVPGVMISDDWNIIDWRSCGKLRQDPPGFQARIVDEHDNPVPPGQVGELIVRTDEAWSMMAGYLGAPEKTADAWRNGWFHTGDAFRSDEDANFYFVDRVKDAIRRRGENISSFEVEAYVNEHPEIVECAAIGVPSEYGEEEVKICVVRKQGSALTAEELIRLLIPIMPRFMIPRYVEFVVALPKTEATARVRKVELKESPINENTWDREKAGVAVPK